MLLAFLLAADWFAGAASVSVAPAQLPVIVNCFFTERSVGKINSPLESKALVLASGQERVALVLVDSCMMPRELLDSAKRQASARTGIPENRILISATHTHFAPAAMACLGSDAQPGYPEFLAAKIADSIADADARRQPARLAATKIDDYAHTFNRRFLYRRGHELTDPFGDKNVIANMHPGYQNPHAVSPSGPVDPALTLLSVQTRTGQPLALLANYSMHYFASDPLSADYFGLYAEKLRARLNAPAGFVVMMTQGTSGDLMWMDYSQPKRDIALDAYTEGIVASTLRALQGLKHQTRGPLAMSERLLTLERRTPSPERLAWARQLMATYAGRKPKTQPEIYAREQVFLHEEPRRELKLQALRIGNLALTALPNEVFALTGLKLKARSPLPLTMNITLANGADGYIPPAEQHELGGYTTWPARTAGLEVAAEKKIVNSLVNQLEEVSGRPSRAIRLGIKMRDYSMDDMEDTPAPIEGPRAYYLEGKVGKAIYVAGGRLRWPSPGTFRFWYWPADKRAWEFREVSCAATCPEVPLEGKVDELVFQPRK